jgi:hypothetical protein
MAPIACTVILSGLPRNRDMLLIVSDTCVVLVSPHLATLQSES